VAAEEEKGEKGEFQERDPSMHVKATSQFEL